MVVVVSIVAVMGETLDSKDHPSSCLRWADDFTGTDW